VAAFWTGHWPSVFAEQSIWGGPKDSMFATNDFNIFSGMHVKCLREVIGTAKFISEAFDKLHLCKFSAQFQIRCSLINCRTCPILDPVFLSLPLNQACSKRSVLGLDGEVTRNAPVSWAGRSKRSPFSLFFVFGNALTSSTNSSHERHLEMRVSIREAIAKMKAASCLYVK